MATALPQPPVARPPVRLLGLLDRAAASHRVAVLLLTIVTLLAILPGFFGIPPIDRDEALFAQISKQMVETGDYVDIRFQDQDFYKKPAGINWLQAAVVKSAVALGMPSAMNSIWAYRIPSLIGAVAAVLLAYWTALAFVGRRPAVLAALMLAVSVMFDLQGRLARTDEVLMAVFVAALGSMARIYLAERRAPGSVKGWLLPAVFWTAMAAGVLLKGPFILLFMGLIAAVLVVTDRSIRWLWALRPIPGVIWLVILLLPWVAAIVSRSGMSFFADSIGHDMLGKVAEGQETHGAPPGYYLVLFIVTFFPAAVLAALAAPRVWALRREAWVRFLLAWIVPAWIIFELVPTKLPHYVLPLYPAIAILIAEAVEFGQAVPQSLAGAGHGRLVPDPANPFSGRHRRPHLSDRRSGASRLAFRLGGGGTRLPCLAALWNGRGGDGAPARVGRQHPHGYCRRRDRLPGHDAALSQRAAGARGGDGRLHPPDGRFGRL